jgi:hypothetical protein
MGVSEEGGICDVSAWCMTCRLTVENYASVKGNC